LQKAVNPNAAHVHVNAYTTFLHYFKSVCEKDGINNVTEMWEESCLLS